MAGIAERLIERRIARVALMVALFPLPVTGIASAALVVMVAQWRGWRDAVIDSLLATTLMIALIAIVGGSWKAMGASALTSWLAAALLGRMSQGGSVVLPIQVAVLVCFAGVMGFFALIQDPQAYWESMIREFGHRASAMGLVVPQPDALLPLATLMTGLIAAGVLVSAVLALMLGTYWSAGRRAISAGDAFAQLRMGAAIGGLVVVVGGLAVARAVPWAGNLLLVAGVGFAVQGLAVLHWHARRAHWPGFWLWAVYLPMAIVPALAAAEVVLLGCFGFADNLFDLRRHRDGMV